jgi:NTP pyrophosphatase (non-canonical NTP hydrolase)
MLIRDLQEDCREWRSRNFPGSNLSDECFMGMVEELGEISHLLLKSRQGIRGIDPDVARVQIEDGVADLLIFMMGFCDGNNIDLQHAVTQTWATVKARDWVTYPEKGVPDVPAP